MHLGKNGFTLVELLVVIGVLAVLATAVVLILNPAEYLRESRDATRIADLKTLNSAINLYINDRGSASDFSLGVTPTDGCNNGTGGRRISVPGIITHTFKATGGSSSFGDRAINGSGWIDIDFTTMASGSPVARLPADPTGNGDYVYRYKCDAPGTAGKYYEINAILESRKFNHTASCAATCRNPGLGFAESDGGDEPSSASGADTLCNATPTPVGNDGSGCVYEVGNKLTL